jgi:hypothetical protein
MAKSVHGDDDGGKPAVGEAPWSRAILRRASVGGSKSASDDENVSGDQAG